MNWRNSLIGPFIGVVACLAGMMPAPVHGGPVGLADPGMVLGRARTAYDLPRQGTPDRPITLLKPFSTDDGCLFDSSSSSASFPRESS